MMFGCPKRYVFRFFVMSSSAFMVTDGRVYMREICFVYIVGVGCKYDLRRKKNIYNVLIVEKKMFVNLKVLP